MARFNRIDQGAGGYAKTLWQSVGAGSREIIPGELVGFLGNTFVRGDSPSTEGKPFCIRCVVKERPATEGFSIDDGYNAGDILEMITPESGRPVAVLVEAGVSVNKGQLFCGGFSKYAFPATLFDGTENIILIALENVAPGATDQLVKFAFL